MNMHPLYIGVVGSGQCTDSIGDLANQVGRLIAEAGAILVCGGLGGIMDTAAAGAKSVGGLTVGILPEHMRAGASRHLDISIPTGMGEMRNALVVRTSDVLIAVCGEFGTLSEIGLALKTGKPVIGLRTWQLVKDGVKDDSIIEASTPEEAVALAIKAVNIA